MFFTLAPEVSCAGLVMADSLLDTEEQISSDLGSHRTWPSEAKPEGKKAG